jgi:hypothetical protein
VKLDSAWGVNITVAPFVPLCTQLNFLKATFEECNKMTTGPTLGHPYLGFCTSSSIVKMLKSYTIHDFCSSRKRGNYELITMCYYFRMAVAEHLLI